MKPALCRKTFTLHALLLALVLVFSTFDCFASDLAEYRKKIRLAVLNLEELLSHADDETEVQMRAEQRELLDEIRAELPVALTVESGGEKFEADNRWLLEKLKQIEVEQPNSDKQRAVISELIERLDAIEKKINELEAQAAGERTKDEDKQKLGEILNRPEYRKPEKKENALQKAWREFLEWFESLFPKGPRRPTEPTGAPALSFTLQLLIFGAVFALIGFLFYRFAPSLLERFRNRERDGRAERVILGERLAEDETSENLFAEAERLAREGDLRAAIRKGYIAVLCELSDRKIIGLSKHKTNRDYLRDVRRRPELHQNLRALTDNFERVWYGFNEVDTRDWEEFRETYKRAISV